MAGSLKVWVKDKLHSILGMSDSSTAEYLIRQAEVNKSVDATINLLSADGIHIDSDMKSFIQELHSRVSGEIYLS